MDVQAIINDLNRLAALQAETNRLIAEIPFAAPARKEEISQWLAKMQQERQGKMMEDDRTS